ncbi:MAG: aminotransferase class I/II-fold pyridoxal phosphate-dependent enzyme [Chitinophagales bacterium]|nr:aminotransferase class I/II-fold pyridoxal phosphate-dependent enzyme [Chitinophagales bacterium]
MKLVSKLPTVGTSIFTTMSALAQEHRAINLGQGFPDFPMSEELIDLVSKAMHDQFNQYAPMAGWLPLREAIAEKISFLYQRAVHPDTDITITPGGTYALYTAFTTILQPGDEVIVFEPAYDSYIPAIELNGAKAVPIALVHPDYHIDWNQVKAACTSRTRAILINTPHNPTGAVWSEQDIASLRSVVEGTDIIIISDEVYEHLIFDGYKHHSILRYPDLFSRSFVCFSFGKVYNCTGWKLGYAVAPSNLMQEFRKIHQFNCFSCHTPVQVALSSFLQQREPYVQLGPAMQERRDAFVSLLKDSRFDLLPSHGSYFILATYDRISQESDTDFAIRLTREAGVTTIPVSAFYADRQDNKVLRFCFAKKQETLEAAAARLRAV